MHAMRAFFACFIPLFTALLWRLLLFNSIASFRLGLRLFVIVQMPLLPADTKEIADIHFGLGQNYEHR